MISITIPFYKMKDHSFFMDRCLESIRKQTYTDYEIVITEEGNAPHNTNESIRKAKGDLIKILYMDDYFTHENALKDIVENFKGVWMVTGCSNNLNPVYTGDIHLGNNKLGGPSVLTFKRGEHEWFDESLVWLFDCDFYKKMYAKYGEPTILNGDNVTVGEGEHQATHLLKNNIKDSEVLVMRKRYV